MNISSISSLVVATQNPGKIREISLFLADLPIKVRSLCDFGTLPDCEEDGDTFLENARVKCAHYFKLTGLPTLADDSGLCVDVLDGLPGVHSARYAGSGATDRARIEKLLSALAGIPDSERSAAFVCALTFQWDTDQFFSCQECVKGHILCEPRGHKGFGYDPVFFYPEENATFAELSAEVKGVISHRGKALVRFRQFLFEELIKE